MVAVVAAGSGRHNWPPANLAGEAVGARMSFVIILDKLFSFVLSIQWYLLQKVLLS